MPEPVDNAVEKNSITTDWPDEECGNCGGVHGRYAMCQARPEPEVKVPMPSKYGSPGCPFCGYKCGCCCHCDCQTPCPEQTIDEDGDEMCEHDCHGGHEPWDCCAWITRYKWAKAKSEALGCGP